jgi:predicted transcriptional regulator
LTEFDLTVFIGRCRQHWNSSPSRNVRSASPELSQPTVSHHLKVLRDAGLVDSERRGLWAYYYVLPDALKELSSWLS